MNESSDWLALEQDRFRAWPEVRRLGERGLRRWRQTVIVALLLTVAAVIGVLKKPRAYTSRVAFRVTERSVGKVGLRTNGRLLEYVTEVIFSNSRLTEVIKAHKLYPSMATQERLALESMREDLKVEVWRNYFAKPESADDPTRTARIGISYQGRNPEQVYAVVQHLGRLIQEHEQRTRLVQAETALKVADEEVDAAHRLLARRQRDLVDMDTLRQKARSPGEGLAILVQERNIERAMPHVFALISQAEQRREHAYLSLRLEKHAIGLKIELIDAGHVQAEGMPRALQAALVGAVVLIFGFVLGGLVVGAFDPLVYNVEDLRHLGLPVAGSLRPFAGDNRGALPERQAEAERRTQAAPGRPA